VKHRLAHSFSVVLLLAACGGGGGNGLSAEGAQFITAIRKHGIMLNANEVIAARVSGGKRA
jgi:hypothetical protein